jgi:hypothetical protein
MKPKMVAHNPLDPLRKTADPVAYKRTEFCQIKGTVC